MSAGSAGRRSCTGGSRGPGRTRIERGTCRQISGAWLLPTSAWASGVGRHLCSPRVRPRAQCAVSGLPQHLWGFGGAPQEEGLSRRSVTAACGSSWTPGRAQTADSKEALGPEHKMFAPKMFTEKKPGHARAPGSVGADAFPTGLSHLSSRYHVCQEDLGGGASSFIALFVINPSPYPSIHLAAVSSPLSNHTRAPGQRPD